MTRDPDPAPGNAHPAAPPGGAGSQPSYVISKVPHGRQRYDTAGDWIPGAPVRINVSSMEDERYVFLVALHELVEYELCRMNGITDGQVIGFDAAFEEERAAGLHPADAEPGDDSRAPYRDEHEFATMVERMVAQKLGVSWSDYEKAVQALGSERLPARLLLQD